MEPITPPRSGAVERELEHTVSTPPNADSALLTPTSMPCSSPSANPPDSPCAGRGKVAAGTGTKLPSISDDVEGRMAAGVEAALAKGSEQSLDQIDSASAAQLIKECSTVEYTFWVMRYLHKALGLEIANGVVCIPGKGYQSGELMNALAERRLTDEQNCFLTERYLDHNPKLKAVVEKIRAETAKHTAEMGIEISTKKQASNILINDFSEICSSQPASAGTSPLAINRPITPVEKYPQFFPTAPIYTSPFGGAPVQQNASPIIKGDPAIPLALAAIHDFLRSIAPKSPLGPFNQPLFEEHPEDVGKLTKATTGKQAQKKYRPVTIWTDFGRTFTYKNLVIQGDFTIFTRKFPQEFVNASSDLWQYEAGVIIKRADGEKVPSFTFPIPHCRSINGTMKHIVLDWRHTVSTLLHHAIKIVSSLRPRPVTPPMNTSVVRKAEQQAVPESPAKRQAPFQMRQVEPVTFRNSGPSRQNLQLAPQMMARPLQMTSPRPGTMSYPRGRPEQGRWMTPQQQMMQPIQQMQSRAPPQVSNVRPGPVSYPQGQPGQSLYHIQQMQQMQGVPSQMPQVGANPMRNCRPPRQDHQMTPQQQHMMQQMIMHHMMIQRASSQTSNVRPGILRTHGSFGPEPSQPTVAQMSNGRHGSLYPQDYYEFSRQGMVPPRMSQTPRTAHIPQVQQNPPRKGPPTPEEMQRKMQEIKQRYQRN